MTDLTTDSKNSPHHLRSSRPFGCKGYHQQNPGTVVLTLDSLYRQTALSTTSSFSSARSLAIRTTTYPKGFFASHNMASISLTTTRSRASTRTHHCSSSGPGHRSAKRGLDQSIEQRFPHTFTVHVALIHSLYTITTLHYTTHLTYFLATITSQDVLNTNICLDCEMWQ